ncbi:cupin domain-containing protein [Halobellus limi]|uniref:Cupin domain-containing protein n=1 Tax=Halobellus limi TaxID=699433 RepID=A0A1H5YRI0_9EURY|nr:cupin domain-containing protein [Halobellus limi]QCC48359.1 cupin domain-containing protein [Halobellus limi]SEG26618.1 Mannose-6-phosphate isomerase, cupin superfamily [Halobellus limi]
METDFSVVDPETIEAERFPESGNRHRKLTDALGCTEMRVNTVTLEPGEATTPHAHERQEEVYVALDGGVVEIAGESYDVAPGGVVRISPEPARSVRNESDDAAQTWVMFGAPPLGTVDDFGEYTVPDGERE